MVYSRRVLTPGTLVVFGKRFPVSVKISNLTAGAQDSAPRG